MSQAILIVDDEPLVGNALARILDEFEVYVATSGTAAMEMLAANPYAVVISDLIMGGTNGLELVAYVADNFPDVVRILMTAEFDLDEHKTAIDGAGLFCLLRKPFSCKQLRESLREALSARTQALATVR